MATIWETISLPFGESAAVAEVAEEEEVEEVEGAVELEEGVEAIELGTARLRNASICGLICDSLT